MINGQNVFFHDQYEKAYPTEGFAKPPYKVECFPIGSCVVNRDGFNCLAFADKPGAKFTTIELAALIATQWNHHD